MKSGRSVVAVLALLVLTASVIQIPAQAQIRQQLKINNAIYGHNGKGMNVTNLLRSMVQNNTLDVKVNNKNMGGDPNVGADKSLKVEYTYQGRTMTKVAKEGDRLQLP
jgi:DnaJ-like protein C11, C-terminal